MKTLFSFPRVIVAGLLALGLGAGLLGGVSCGEADRTFDCQQVCSKYEDCFDSSTNVGQCRDRCRANARNDADYERKADVCEDCLDGKSCAEATLSCAADCAGIVLQ